MNENTQLHKFESDLSLELLHAVEEAAVASARTMGEGGGREVGSGRLLMTMSTNKVRFVDTVLMETPPGPRGIRLT